MKSIVVEIESKDVVVLSDDGVFSKVKNNNYEIGQVIIMKEARKKSSRFIAGVASFAAAIAVFTIGGFAYFTPTDYVSLDVNPSIEYSVNMFDRILDVKAVNDDGEEILSSLYLDNMTIKDAVKETIDRLIASGYLTDDEDGGVIITTSNSRMDKAEKLSKVLKKEIQKYIDEQDGITTKVEVEAVGKARVEEAKELGVTPGKLNLVEKLQASAENPDDIHIEEWLNKPVKEINKAIKENREKAKEVYKGKDKIKDQDLEENDSIKDDNDSTKDEDSNKTYKNDKILNKNKPIKDKYDEDAIEDMDDDIDKPQENDKIFNNNKPVKNNDKIKPEKVKNFKGNKSTKDKE